MLLNVAKFLNLQLKNKQHKYKSFWNKYKTDTKEIEGGFYKKVGVFFEMIGEDMDDWEVRSNLDGIRKKYLLKIPKL